MTGQLFTDTYFVRDGNRQAFLIAGKLLTSVRYKGRENERNIFQPSAHNHIIDTEGGIPAIVTRIRFMKSIAKAGDNEARVFCLLNQILTEDAIKELYYDVWLQWHNQMAQKSARRAIQEHRHLMKDRVHNDVVRITRNGNVRKFLRDGGVYG